jgi:hypothetical protein
MEEDALEQRLSQKLALKTPVKRKERPAPDDFEDAAEESFITAFGYAERSMPMGENQKLGSDMHPIAPRPPSTSVRSPSTISGLPEFPEMLQPSIPFQGRATAGRSHSTREAESPRKKSKLDPLGSLTAPQRHIITVIKEAFVMQSRFSQDMGSLQPIGVSRTYIADALRKHTVEFDEGCLRYVV